MVWKVRVGCNIFSVTLLGMCNLWQWIYWAITGLAKLMQPFFVDILDSIVEGLIGASCSFLWPTHPLFPQYMIAAALNRQWWLLNSRCLVQMLEHVLNHLLKVETGVYLICHSETCTAASSLHASSEIPFLGLLSFVDVWLCIVGLIVAGGSSGAELVQLGHLQECSCTLRVLCKGCHHFWMSWSSCSWLSVMISWLVCLIADRLNLIWGAWIPKPLQIPGILLRNPVCHYQIWIPLTFHTEQKGFSVW